MIVVAVPQQKIREVVFQLLFSYDLAQPKNADIEQLLVKELSLSRKTVREAGEKMLKILAHRDEIDAKIEETACSYAFSRIQKVEKNILRLAVYELCYDDQIPPKVAIVEALRLAKKFSTREAASFVNAILDAIYKREQGSSVDVSGVIEAFDAMIEHEDISQDISQDIALEQKKSEIGDAFDLSEE